MDHLCKETNTAFILNLTLALNLIQHRSIKWCTFVPWSNRFLMGWYLQSLHKKSHTQQDEAIRELYCLVLIMSGGQEWARGGWMGWQNCQSGKVCLKYGGIPGIEINAPSPRQPFSGPSWARKDKGNILILLSVAFL